MAAPQTNIEKQKRWHRGPLIGMALVVIFGVGLITYWLIDESANRVEPDPTPAIQGQDAPADDAPTATAPTATAPTETAPTKTAPTETAPTETVPAPAPAAPAPAPPAGTAPAP